MTQTEVRRQFIEIINSPDRLIELDRAALLIAAEEYPRLNPEKYLQQLDYLAAEANERLPKKEDAFGRLLGLSKFLFQDCGFGGNVENYYDVRNSFLNDVIERRKGLPITLSVVFIEVARRLGLTVYGVGLPGHFIVKFFDTSEEEVLEIYLDPFHGGRVLSEEDCRGLVEKMYQGKVSFNRSFLATVTRCQILTRMLQNLKVVYTRAANHHKTLGVIERLLLIVPDAITEVRDRGLAYLALGRFTQARIDLENYLNAVPQAGDAAQIKEAIQRARQRQAQLN